MPEWGVSLIVALAGVLASGAGVLGVALKIIDKRLTNGNTGNSNNGNGYAKRSEISNLHEKINTLSKEQSVHCAAQLKDCNTQFNKIMTDRATDRTLLETMASDIVEIKDRR